LAIKQKVSGAVAANAHCCCCSFFSTSFNWMFMWNYVAL